MYGLDAINAYNGWAISVVGVTIVFTGLVTLSMAISQLHKLLDLWENRKELSLFKKKSPATDQPLVAFTPGQKESSRQFKLLAETLNDHFSLPRLLKLAQISGIDHPHATLATLLEADIIVSDTQGYHVLDMARFNTLVS
ncbi:Oxaloacetate decarboxylase, gamma chain [Desulfocicer vacuolatum DSM 3385]|uniref:Oxaloacetate decarboxylase, gamma chain n=1 Tax=Desulfocicer vacuolatum DSM 3385 TaxID=1121400 RepID=A0A1W1ZTE0_9BACT|nr:OadG family protein [Desulfocicer vacuolatum]SMC51522.1 Oxaloacetate decarboxylase, gamma chain [Desulfocicer vacuolatum DSM 3385]